MSEVTVIVSTSSRSLRHEICHEHGELAWQTSEAVNHVRHIAVSPMSGQNQMGQKQILHISPSVAGDHPGMFERSRTVRTAVFCLCKSLAQAPLHRLGLAGSP